MAGAFRASGTGVANMDSRSMGAGTERAIGAAGTDAAMGVAGTDSGHGRSGGFGRGDWSGRYGRGNRSGRYGRRVRTGAKDWSGGYGRRVWTGRSAGTDRGGRCGGNGQIYQAGTSTVRVCGAAGTAGAGETGRGAVRAERPRAGRAAGGCLSFGGAKRVERRVW